MHVTNVSADDSYCLTQNLLASSPLPLLCHALKSTSPIDLPGCLAVFLNVATPLLPLSVPASAPMLLHLSHRLRVTGKPSFTAPLDVTTSPSPLALPLT